MRNNGQNCLCVKLKSLDNYGGCLTGFGKTAFLVLSASLFLYPIMVNAQDADSDNKDIEVVERSDGKLKFKTTATAERLSVGVPLRRLECEFVRPVQITLREERHHANAVITFFFKQDEDPMRRIELTLVFRDDKGIVLNKSVRECKDMRIAARTSVRRSGNLRIYPMRMNYEGFRIKKSIVSRVHEIETTFESVKTSQKN